MSLLFPTLRGYRREWLRPDVLAGLAAGATTVAMPTGVPTPHQRCNSSSTSRICDLSPTAQDVDRWNHCRLHGEIGIRTPPRRRTITTLKPHP